MQKNIFKSISNNNNVEEKEKQSNSSFSKNNLLIYNFSIPFFDFEKRKQIHFEIENYFSKILKQNNFEVKSFEIEGIFQI